MKTLCFFLIFVAICMSAPADSYYTPQTVTRNLFVPMHPEEAARGDEYRDQLIRAGENIRCGAAVAAWLNRERSKVFHNGIIAPAFVKWELLPDRPSDIRFGLFADSTPQSVMGVGSFTTGRSGKDPWQLLPDVTGLSIGLSINGHWVALTLTASQGAFGRTIDEFSDLAGFSARDALRAGLLSQKEAEKILEQLRQGNWPDDDTSFSPLLRRLAMAAGGSFGEARFVATHPLVGLFTLVPATLAARNNPLLGYHEIGFGSGQSFLLSEEAPFEKRRSFRIGVRLAKNEFNDRIRKESPNLFQTLISGAMFHRHLELEFTRWSNQADIEMEVYLVVDDTGIDAPHVRPPNKNEIPVAKLTILRRAVHARYGSLAYGELERLVKTMPFNPGFNMHLPLGNLGVGRSASLGAYWRSQALRRAPGFAGVGPDFNPRDLIEQVAAGVSPPLEFDMKAIDAQVLQIPELHKRYWRDRTEMYGSGVP
jgi:hypothetical protein